MMLKERKCKFNDITKFHAGGGRTYRDQKRISRRASNDGAIAGHTA